MGASQSLKGGRLQLLLYKNMGVQWCLPEDQARAVHPRQNDGIRNPDAVAGSDSNKVATDSLPPKTIVKHRSFFYWGCAVVLIVSASLLAAKPMT